MKDTRPLLLPGDFPVLRRQQLEILQVNLGYLCNLSCTHCHVNAGPKRTELMQRETIDSLLAFMQQHHIKCLDLTGGAPEMNPHFRDLVIAARKMGVEVIDRCNLTILSEPGYEDLAEFLAQNKVQVTASLPCYEEQNVAEQRGKGVFQSSIEGLQKLNELGYGIDKELSLDLVYNPNGAFLPPEQAALEQDYKAQLDQEYGIHFNRLLTITNMPISRFGGMLLAKGLYEDYMALLKGSYSSENMAAVMCRSLISIDWQGYVYDCDFNQMLNLPLQSSATSVESKPLASDKLIASDVKAIHIDELLQYSFAGQSIVVGDHCYGCTAGQGSSCGGALESA
jgi:radical SAM/Cys-rich protein